MEIVEEELPPLKDGGIAAAIVIDCIVLDQLGLSTVNESILQYMYFICRIPV